MSGNLNTYVRSSVARAQVRAVSRLSGCDRVAGGSVAGHPWFGCPFLVQYFHTCSHSMIWGTLILGANFLLDLKPESNVHVFVYQSIWPNLHQNIVCFCIPIEIPLPTSCHKSFSIFWTWGLEALSGFVKCALEQEKENYTHWESNPRHVMMMMLSYHLWFFLPLPTISQQDPQCVLHSVPAQCCDCYLSCL